MDSEIEQMSQITNKRLVADALQDDSFAIFKPDSIYVEQTFITQSKHFLLLNTAFYSK